jgi:hypothetical protein
MNRILEIDKVLTEELAEFIQIAESLNFDVIGDIRNEDLINEHDYSGVYLIEVENNTSCDDFESWFNQFQIDWELPKYKKCWTLNSKKKRVEKHTVLGQWVPLYIGKSKRVSKRLLTHLNLKLEQPTTSLKLKARANMNSLNFRFSTIKVDVKNYDIIMPMLEKTLRDQINPILGRQ